MGRIDNKRSDALYQQKVLEKGTKESAMTNEKKDVEKRNVNKEAL
jgi:hypothetical protein